MFDNIKEDLKMYLPQVQNYHLIKKFIHLFFTQEIYAVLIFRFGRWSTYKLKIPVLSHFFVFIYFFLRKASQIFIGVDIVPESDIAPGLKIEHWGGTIFGPIKCGRCCRVSQQVVVGHRGGFKGGGLPTLGENVYIGAGAKILGKINIGNNVIIGANAVVLMDIPDNALAVGVPAIIKLQKDK